MLKFTPENLNLGRNPIYSQVSYNVNIDYNRVQEKLEDYILEIIETSSIDQALKQEIIDDITLMNTPVESAMPDISDPTEPSAEPTEPAEHPQAVFEFFDISYIEIIEAKSEAPKYILVVDTDEQNKTNKIISISGEGTLEIFNLYSITHVNKGQSDKTETPVVSELADVPDKKDIFKISVDPRISKMFEIYINIKLHKKVQIKRILDSEIVFENDGITDYNKTYVVEISQTYDKIKEWVDDYFKTRY